MWKRLNHQRGSRQPVTGGPVLNESAFDENTYADGLGIDVNRAQSPQDRSGRPPRPPRNDIPKGLPILPLETSAPPTHENQESKFRPASSIYSQPSPNAITSRFPAYSYPSTTAYNDGVSPPSSPEIGATVKKSQGQTDDHDVSPIDETPDISRLGFRRPPSRPGSSSKPPSSSIPILRREKRRNQVAAAAANLVTRKEVGNGSREKKIVDVRWDPYSGEQTTSEKGKPQSVKPGQFTPPGLRSVHEPTGLSLGNESSVSAAAPKNQKSFGERVRNMRINAPVPAERPEWKGASGRVALVSPVADQMDIPPLDIPRKSSKRVASPHSAQSGSRTPVSVSRSGGGGETYPASAETAEHIDPTIKSVLIDSARGGPRVLLNSPISVTPDPVANATPNNAPASATAPEENYRQHQKRDSTGTIERNFREALKEVSFATGDSYVQPPSRFSVTTYAPSEVQITPRPSTDTGDRPAMPTPPQTFTSTQELSPILNRMRPKVGEGSRTTTRKAVAPSPPIFINMSSSIASKRSSNIAKTLPQSPAEVQSIDLISSLQAQLDDLAHRRNNITKSIRQMTELMPTDGVLITDEVRRKREGEKRKVEGLREEEADVRRLEHEIGLRLHRAYKRKDKDATYEPTGLWVRRVTG